MLDNRRTKTITCIKGTKAFISVDTMENNLGGQGTMKSKSLIFGKHGHESFFFFFFAVGCAGCGVPDYAPLRGLR